MISASDRPERKTNRIPVEENTLIFRIKISIKANTGSARSDSPADYFRLKHFCQFLINDREGGKKESGHYD